MDILRPALMLVSAAMFFIIKLIKKTILSADPDRFDKNKALFTNPLMVHIKSCRGGIGHFVLMSVVVNALCDSIAICGLVLFLIAGSSFDYYLFMALSLVYAGIFFTRFAELLEWYRRREQKNTGGKKTVFE